MKVYTTGAGAPLVLVHGSWSDHHTWDLVAGSLAGSFRVIRYDRPTRPTRRHHEDDLAAIIEGAGAPARVLGTSFGGSIALGLATRRPELFEALAVHEPPLLTLAGDDPSLAEVGGAVATVLELIEQGDRRGAAERFADFVLGPGAFGSLPPQLAATMVATAGSFAAEMGDPRWAELEPAAVACPLLVTDGTESPVWLRAVAAVLDGEKHTFAGAGHAPHHTHPVDFVAVAERFLAPVALAR